MKSFYFYFLLFLIYSFIGWIIEVISCSIIDRKFVNRGFMIGPYVPIFGYSSIIMIIYLSQYKNNPLTVFLLAFIICSIIEYFISYIMEVIFKTRWWDYSNKKYNINGRICLGNCFAFGALGVLLIYHINPFITKYINLIEPKILTIISTITLVLFVTDFIISLNVTKKLKESLSKLNLDSTREIREKTKELFKKKILQRRIILAFPKFKLLIKFKRNKNSQNKQDNSNK